MPKLECEKIEDILYQHMMEKKAFEPKETRSICSCMGGNESQPIIFNNKGVWYVSGEFYYQLLDLKGEIYWLRINMGNKLELFGHRVYVVNDTDHENFKFVTEGD